MKKKTLTIAFVSDAVAPFNKGGKETRTYEIIRRLAARGHEVHVYCMKWWGRSNTYCADGITYHAICPYIPLYSRHRRSIRQAVIFGLSTLRLLSAQFDVVDVDSMPYLPVVMMWFVTRMKRSPMVSTWHEVWSRQYWKKYVGVTRGTVAFAIERQAARLPDALIAVSDRTKKRIREIYQRSRKVYAIGGGIDAGHIAGIPSAKSGADLVYAGRLLNHKHIDHLLKAAFILKAVYKHTRLSVLIVGDGPERKRLENLRDRLNLTGNVRFTGFYDSYDRVLGIYKASRLFVLPSSREGFGLSVLEANAAGLPVLTVDFLENAATDLITVGKNGFVVKPDPDDMAKSIDRFLRRTPGSMSNDCIRIAKKHSWDSATDEAEYLYRSLVK